MLRGLRRRRPVPFVLALRVAVVVRSCFLDTVIDAIDAETMIAKLPLTSKVPLEPNKKRFEGSSVKISSVSALDVMSISDVARESVRTAAERAAPA